MNTFATDHVVVVTGAARGLGRAIAIAFAQAGATVVGGVRSIGNDSPLLEELISFSPRSRLVHMDVTDLDGSRGALDRIADEYGRIDTLVNNAGGGIAGPALDVSEGDFDAVWSLNAKSTFFLSQHAAKVMRRQGVGSIVNVASQAGLVALPGESSYCVSKAAVIHMTRCQAVEWGDFGIRVNAVAPTFIETDGTAAALSDPEFRADTISRIAALHRIGVPSEVSGAVVFLASPAASLITGQTLAIDGGWTAR